MSGHTPGPWTHVQRPNGLVHIVTADLDTCVAIIPVAGDFTNAPLLAAAPALLTALENTDCAFCGRQMREAAQIPCPRCADARAAVRAARGLEDS